VAQALPTRAAASIGRCFDRGLLDGGRRASAVRFIAARARDHPHLMLLADRDLARIVGEVLAAAARPTDVQLE